MCSGTKLARSSQFLPTRKPKPQTSATIPKNPLNRRGHLNDLLSVTQQQQIRLGYNEGRNGGRGFGYGRRRRRRWRW